MNYYHDLVTEKSWRELQQLQRRLPFVLIGGWAVYLYAKALKSKDIDVIVDYDQLPILQKHYLLRKNERLKKYEALQGEVEIDIYLPHYSRLGIPVETLLLHAKKVEGFTVLDSDYLIALKIYTLSQRGRSSKGKKDFLDIISLLRSSETPPSRVQQLLAEYKLRPAWQTFGQFLDEYTQLPELNLNVHQYNRLKQSIGL